MQVVLKVNSKAIRNRLEEAGLELCSCCTFDQAVWLHLSSNLCKEVMCKIHGIGYSSEEGDKVEKILRMFEIEETDYTDCGYDVEKFIELYKQMI